MDMLEKIVTLNNDDVMKLDAEYKAAAAAPADVPNVPNVP
jgi:hypothetical protein